MPRPFVRSTPIRRKFYEAAARSGPVATRFYRHASGLYGTHNGVNRWVPAIAIFPDPVQTGFASYHPGGCHFVLSDANVHFLSEAIDAHALRWLTTGTSRSRTGLADALVNVDAF